MVFCYNGDGWHIVICCHGDDYNGQFAVLHRGIREQNGCYVTANLIQVCSTDGFLGHVTIMWLSCDYHVIIMWLSCDWFLPRDGWPSRRLWRKLSQQTVDDRVVSWTLSPHDSSLGNFFVNYSFFSSFICSGSRCPCGEYCNNKKFQRVRLASYFSPSIPLSLFFPSSSFPSYPSLPFPPSSLPHPSTGGLCRS